MNTADGMRNITEKIVADYHVRVNALGNRVNEVNDLLDKFASDRKAMSKEQAAELAHFAHDLASRIQKELKLMCKERMLSAKNLKSRMQKEARDLRNLTKKTLSDYEKDHAEMGEALRHNLHDYVNGIVKTVGDLLGGYRADMCKAGNIWRDMTRTLAKGGVLPVSGRRKKKSGHAEGNGPQDSETKEKKKKGNQVQDSQLE